MTALMGLDARLKMARLYLVMDAMADRHQFTEFVDAVLAGGVDILQVRQGRLSPEQALERLEDARSIAFRHQGIVVVHQDAGVAARFKADSLHLGAADGPSAPARTTLHQWALLGRSTHSGEQVEAALADPAVAYLWVGPTFDPTPNPTYPTPGLPLVQQAARLAPPGDPAGKPWFAVGGITPDNVDDVVAAGARRIAVSGAITRAADPEAAATRLKDRMRQVWHEDPAMEQYVFAAFSSGPRATFAPSTDDQA